MHHKRLFVLNRLPKAKPWLLLHCTGSELSACCAADCLSQAGDKETQHYAVLSSISSVL